MSKITAIILSILFCTQVFAVSQFIGDADGFGFGDLSKLSAFNGGPVDLNGNGILDAGDLLPDLDADGFVAVIGLGGGDVFDHRESGELWTDISLANDYTPAPGGDCWKADSAEFRFKFSPESVDHILTLVYADYDTDVMEVATEGQIFPLIKSDASVIDGLIREINVRIPGSCMLDGEVLVEIAAPGEPYVAFDYVSLTPIPAPGSLILCSLGAGLVGWIRFSA